MKTPDYSARKQGKPIMDMDTYEKDINRELDEMLAMLKTLENKLISQTSGDISGIRDLFAIHMAVLQGYYDMSEALEFIQRLYTGCTGDA